MWLMPPPKSEKSWPIFVLPVASPHFGKKTCASSANRSRMLPPLEVTPALSNALRYSSATDLRCSSVIVSFETATTRPSLSTALDIGRHGAQLRVESEPLAVAPAAERADERARFVERQRRHVAAERRHQAILHQVHLDIGKIERGHDAALV